MLNAAAKTGRFFKQEAGVGRGGTAVWRLKTQDEFLQTSNARSKETRKFVFRNLEDIVQVRISLVLGRLRSQAVFFSKGKEC